MSANYVAWQIAYNFLNLEVPQRPMVYPAQPKKIEKLKHQSKFRFLQLRSTWRFISYNLNLQNDVH